MPVAIGWLSWRAERTFFTVLSPAVVIVPLLFVGSGGVRSVAWGSGEPAAGATITGSTPVVLVVFDELPLVTLLNRDGQLDPVRYPNLAGLAADGIWFRNTTAVSDFTRWAVPAIVTGRYPIASQLPTFGDHRNSLITLLASRYRVKAEEPATALCPRSICASHAANRSTRAARMLADVRTVAAHILLPPAARNNLPDLSQGWASFDRLSRVAYSDSHDSAGDAADRRSPDLGPGVGHLTVARSFIDGIGHSAAQPTLYFLHTLISHHPPRWLPTGQLIRDRQGARARDRDGRWVADEWPVVEHYQGHLMQVALADALVGQLRTRLKKIGLYDRALIVITSDHGVSFRPGDLMREVTETNAADILAVPLVMKLPQGHARATTGTIDDRLVETVDVLPTIADVLGVALPWKVDGLSAVAGERAGRNARIYVDDAKEVREFRHEKIAAGVEAAVERKVALLGTEVWPATRVHGTDRLLGRSLASVPLAEETTGLRPRLARPLALENVDLNATVLPAQVTGWVEPRSRAARQPVAVAVALNERIVATTETLPAQARWSALVPPSMLRDGANRLDVLLVDPKRPDVLWQSKSSADGADRTNLALGAAALWGVEQSGFHRAEIAGGFPFRWTTGNASIKVPIDPAHPPSHLELSVVASGPAGKELHVEIDRCEALAARLPKGRWSKTIALGECAPHGYWADIAIKSDVHIPSGRDSRRLGVALARLTLE